MNGIRVVDDTPRIGLFALVNWVRQLRYSLAAAQVVGGVLMIPEVASESREIFGKASPALLVPHSLTSTVGSVAPPGAATLAPSLGATNTDLGQDVQITVRTTRKPHGEMSVTLG